MTDIPSSVWPAFPHEIGKDQAAGNAYRALIARLATGHEDQEPRAPASACPRCGGALKQEGVIKLILCVCPPAPAHDPLDTEP